MARVVKKPVYGSLSSCARILKPPIAHDREDSISLSSSSSLSECSLKRKDDFLLRYEDSDEEESSSNPKYSQISNSFVDLVSQRSLGFERHGHFQVNPEYGTRHLLTNGNFREHTIKLGEMNKIFCSQWLNNRQIVFGSKCNKLTVYDILKKETFSIPLLKCLENRKPPASQCGIHSLAINPSRSILATGAENTKDIAFYKLPTFDPLAVGEGAHDDWMFDLQWLDDYFLVSGSRDTTMALWRLNDDCHSEDSLFRFKALVVKKCRTAEKVRALAYNKQEMEIAALSLNGYIHVWKVAAFKQIRSQKLHHGLETVCMSYQDEHNVYAIGSRSHTTILDARTLQPIQNKNIVSLFPTSGIRSVSFRGDILTIGTGTGAVLFYDLRATKYMHFNDRPEEIMFKTNTGWVPSDEAVTRYTPAIYTHCYDETGTRFFAAGGPLAIERKGHYASIWK